MVPEEVEAYQEAVLELDRGAASGAAEQVLSGPGEKAEGEDAGGS